MVGSPSAFSTQLCNTCSTCALSQAPSTSIARWPLVVVSIAALLSSLLSGHTLYTTYRRPSAVASSGVSDSLRSSPAYTELEERMELLESSLVPPSPSLEDRLQVLEANLVPPEALGISLTGRGHWKRSTGWQQGVDEAGKHCSCPPGPQGPPGPPGHRGRRGRTRIILKDGREEAKRENP